MSSSLKEVRRIRRNLYGANSLDCASSKNNRVWGVRMWNLLVVTALLLAFNHAAAGGELLTPGIYRLDDKPVTVANEQPVRQRKHELNVDRFEHAVPSAAKVRFAIASRNDETNLNKVVFLVGPAYHIEKDSIGRLCSAYAFPDLTYQSGDQPFCRTSRGVGDDAAQLTVTTNSITVAWPENKSRSRYEIVPPRREASSEEVGACAFGTCSEDAYGYRIDHYVTTHYLDSFSLQVSRRFSDILYLSKPLSMYSQPDRAAPATNLAVGGYAAVMATTHEWYEIDFVGQDGAETRGFVNRDDLLDSEWIDQSAQTREFQFRVATKQVEEPGTDSAVQAIAVEVVDRQTGKRAQVIYDLDSEPWVGPAEDQLGIVDANFDGYPDLRLFRMSGGAGPNSTENYFLFNPRTGRFEYSAELSDLAQVVFDAKTRTVMSSFRNGCCDHSSQTYRFINARLTLIADWEERMSSDGNWLETTKGKLKNGKMVRRTTRRPVPKNW